MKKRIPISGPQSALQSPFALLKMTGLPDAPLTAPPLPHAKLGRVVLRRETSHRGGKKVIVVSDFSDHIPLAEIQEFARKARQHCGCGGTVREREIELQGDQPQRIREFFEKSGFRVAGI